MCGIYGWFDETTQFQKIYDESGETPRAQLRHRGPDGFGSVKSSNYYAEHHRLKIVGNDFEGKQPYLDKNKNSGLVFNGEIYNFAELREELKNDFPFSTNSDGEVLFVGLEIQGELFLRRLRGIFTGFYWSEEKNTAILFRDQFGVKPLYYRKKQNKIFFSSEIRPLLEENETTRINHQAFYEHLRLRYALGSQTVFEEVEKVSPGEIFDLRNNQKRSFYYQEDEELTLGEKFRESVEMEIPGFPFYSLLSGGIDSSAIASELERKTKLVRFMTIRSPGFEEKEASASLKTGKLLDTCDVADISENDLKVMVESLEEPIGDSIGLVQKQLFNEISSRTKVAMSGEGADELFFGYAHYWMLFVLEKIKWFPFKFFLNLLSFLPFSHKLFPYEINPSRKHLDQIFRPWSERASFTEKAAHAMSIFSEKEALDLLPVRERHISIENKMKNIANLNDLRKFDLKNWLPSYNLHRLDRLSMAHSLELRVPYLDQSFANCALRYSAENNLSLMERKRVLRQAFKGLLPESARKRKKRAFTVNADNARRLGLRKICLDVLEKRGAVFFNPIALKNVLQDTDHYFYDKRLFNLTILVLWCERFKE